MKVRSTFAPGYKTRSCRDCCYERLTMHHQKEGKKEEGKKEEGKEKRKKGRKGTCSILAYLTFRLTQQGARGASSFLHVVPHLHLFLPLLPHHPFLTSIGRKRGREILEQDLEREREKGTMELSNW